MPAVRRATGVGATLLAVAAVSLALTSVASAISAYPVKKASDSGVVTQDDYFNASIGSPDFWDACVIAQPYNDFSMTFQQYTITGCTPVASPFIQLKALGTRGWAVYCPQSAPNTWIESAGGGLQGYSDTNGSWAIQEIQEDNSYGPSPPAKSDYFMTNWTFHEVHFGFVVGCSPQVWETDTGLPPYCCGQGPSAGQPFPTSAAGKLTTHFARGPRDRRTTLPGHRYTESREVNLGPHATKTLTMQCDHGLVPYFHQWGVGWYTHHVPTKKDGHVQELPAKIKRGFKITAKANGRVKPRAARLQAVISCHRPGRPAPRARSGVPPFVPVRTPAHP
jgi:hypothetical protein